MAKKMLIDATHLEETRVVVADGNKVDEFDFESINKRQLAGNIYLAKVTRVEPSLQAAFVDYGGNRHGFLAFSEIHPDYYQIPVADREALLAEEAAEQARSAAGEDNGEADGVASGDTGEEKSRSRSRRGKRRARGKPAEAPSENGDIKGLEVIELSGEAAGADDTTAPAETPAPQVRGLEIGGLPDDDSANGEAEAEQSDTTPKTIAESAGLDDDDSVSEEVLDAASKPGEAEEENKPKPKPARKRTRKKAPPAPLEEAPDTVSAEATVAEKAVAETDGDTAAEATPSDAAEDAPASDDSKESAAETASETSSDSPEQPAVEKAAKPARPRKRRSRAREQDVGEETATETADTVELIGPDDPQEEAAKFRAKRRRHYKIQDVVKVRQIMLVQVVKEERGNKGAALTTYLSLAGRYCVLMPNTARGGGISRKITSIGDRKRLRDITGALEVPAGMGLIVRTAGADRTRPEIKRDYEFLLRQWEQIRELTLISIAPTLIYEEGSLIKRSIRDLYSKEIDAILVEGEDGYREAKDYMKMLMPSHAKHVQQYQEQIPLFIRYQVESYLNAMFSPVVQLRSGGYIVIGITEALVAIDVNSGRSTKESSIEETALKTNLEAADEVARQLRLRDLAGLIVIDFIDMDENRNNRAVEKRMKDRLKSDRARIQIGRISAFGLMEMSRQRLRPGMLEATTQPCPLCQGQGIVRSDENLSLSILREVEEEGVRGRSAEVTVTAPIGIANYIMNMKRAHLNGIEQRYGIVVSINGDPLLTSPEFRIDRSKTRSRRIDTPDVVITAESVAAPPSIEAVEAVPETIPDEKPDERGDERGEGRSRRRRGKRGGQRRRREEGESGGEDSAGQAGESTQGAVAEGAPDSGEGAEAERKPSGERRSRRRGGRGRSRSRRQDDDAVATTGADGPKEDGEATAQSAGDAPETPAGTPDQPAPLETAATEASENVAAEKTVTEAPSEPETEQPATVEEVAPEPEPVPEPEPTPEPTPEPVAAAPDEPAPEKPAAPKRRGWWSRG
ncbi:MAG: Rne/Rng family ribonuclease [Alphaproteobacteria bacterium]